MSRIPLGTGTEMPGMALLAVLGVPSYVARRPRKYNSRRTERVMNEMSKRLHNEQYRIGPFSHNDRSERRLLYRIRHADYPVPDEEIDCADGL